MALEQPQFAKLARVAAWDFFTAKNFLGGAAVALLAESAQFLINVIRGAFDPMPVLVNVLLLNLFVLGLIVLALQGRLDLRRATPLLARKKGTVAVYVYQEGALRHVPDEETFLLLGYSFSQVQDIPEAEFATYRVGPPLQSIRAARLIRADGTHEVFAILDERRRHVPNAFTLKFIQGFGRSVDVVTREELKKYREGLPLISVLQL